MNSIDSADATQKPAPRAASPRFVRLFLDPASATAPRVTARPKARGGTSSTRPKATPAAATTPVPKVTTPTGRLTYAYTPFPNSLDPHNNAGAASGNMLRSLYDPLAELQPDGSMAPALAESWRNVDPTTWEFKLRPGVRFSNGQPLTAETVKFNIERVANPANSLQITALPGIGVAGWGATVVSPDTVRITTRTPDPVLVRKLNLLLIIPDGQAAQNIGQTGIGTGTYKVRSFTPTQTLTVEPVMDNWRKVPGLAEVTLQFVGDPAVRAAGLRTGEVGFTTLSADLSGPFTNDPQFTVVTDLGAASISLEMFPANAEGPLRELAVRQAIQAAIDPQGLLNALFRGQGEVSQGQLYDRRAFGFDPSLQAPRQDVARARQLLAQAGFPNGFQARLQIIPTSNSIGTDLGTAIQGQLGAVGIQVTLDPVDFATYTQRLLQGGVPDMILAVNEFSATLDAQTVLNNYVWTGNFPNRRFNDPTYNQLIQQAGVEFDENRRRQLLGQAARILVEQQATGFLFQTKTQFIHQARYQGFVPAPDLNPRFYNWTVRN